MSKLSSATALNAKVFVRQFRALIMVAEALEEIGNIEKYKSDADGLKSKAIKDLQVAEEALVVGEDKLKITLEEIKDAEKKAIARKNLNDHMNKEIQKAVKGMSIELEKVTDRVLVAKTELETYKEKSRILANEITLQEKNEEALKTSVVRLRKEMDALKARF